MSEKLKSDTSRQIPTTVSWAAASPMVSVPNPAPVVKNPLLSASVTGLTFDDFPNKPLLLPPAAVSREPKPLVTIANPLDVDTESLDEINLNTTSEDTQSVTDIGTITRQIDTNANPLWVEPQSQPGDSILSQAASSFSALPAVASNVLSTFSKRISEYSGSTSRERSPPIDNNKTTLLDRQPAYLQQAFQTEPQQQSLQEQPTVSLHQELPYLSAQHASTQYPANSTSSAGLPLPTLESNVPPLATPKFYTPAEVPILPTVNAVAPPPPGGQNTYRLAAKKKLYAPIPGLSDQTVGIAVPKVHPLSTAALDKSTQQLPQVSQNSYSQSEINLTDSNYQIVQSLRQEERKVSGLFANISNLVPSGVLQNISGLVQTAADSFAQNKSVAEQPPVAATSGGTGNYFGVSVGPTSTASVPEPYFCSVPSGGNHLAAAFDNPSQPPYLLQSAAPVSALQDIPKHENIQSKSVDLQSSAIFVEANQPIAKAPQLPSSVPQLVSPPPTTGFIAAPTKANLSDSTKQRSSVAPITYLEPAKQPLTSSLSFGSPLQSSAPRDPASDSNPSSAGKQFANIFTPSSAIHVHKPSQQPLRAVTSASPPLPTTTQVVQRPIAGFPLFNPSTPILYNPTQVPSVGEPTDFLGLSPVSTQPSSSFPALLATPTQIGSSPIQSVSSNQALPPPTSSGPTSFRLQKGTRLYKSPLTSTETTPGSIPAAVVQPLAPPSNIFNPFEVPAATNFANQIPSTSIAAPTLVPSYFIAQPAESSVGLFPVDKAEGQQKQDSSLAKSDESGTSIFNTTITEVPQTFTVPAIAEEKPQESAVEQSTTTVDLVDIIQQQTIEAVLPELTSPTSPDKREQSNLSDRPTTVTSKPDCVSDALKHLSIAAEPQQSQILQNLSESSLNIKHTQGHTVSQASTNLQETQQRTDRIAGGENQHDSDSSSLQAPQLNLLHLVSTASEHNPAINSVLPPSLPHANLSQLQTITPNPFRKSVGASSVTSATLSKPGIEPILANFFSDTSCVDTSSVAAFNILTPLQQPPLQGSTAEVGVSSAVIPSPQQLLPTSAAASVTPYSVPSTVDFFGAVEPNQLSLFQAATTQQATGLPQLPPPLLNHEPSTTAAVTLQSIDIPPPLGFDNLIPITSLQTTGSGSHKVTVAPVQLCTDTNVTVAAQAPAVQSFITGSSSDTQHSGVVKSFSNYFHHTSNCQNRKSQQQQRQIEPTSPAQQSTIVASSPANFFDNFASAPAQPRLQAPFVKEPLPPTDVNSLQQQQQQSVAQSNEDQRLQNFFNNPPQRENSAGVGDLGYDLVHSGLAIRNLPVRSLTPISNLVEPPSSSCSEFSELNNSSANARVLPTELLIKRSPEKSVVITESSQETPAKLIEAASTSVEILVKETPSNLQPDECYRDLPEEVLSELNMANLLIGEKDAASSPPITVQPYSPAVKHWFYKRPSGSERFVWTPFSHYDSALIETTMSMDNDDTNIVSVEGGRYDVNIKERKKSPVYWDSASIEVRRCSWFYKGSDSNMVPYEEEIADLLESEYKQATESGEWHKKIILSMGGQVTFHGPTVIVHFQQQQSSDSWGGTSQTTTRPRVVKRDLNGFQIEQGESQHVDHLLLMVHGIGAACDLKMRSVDEVVDDFRHIAQALIQSHYKNSVDTGLIGRVEVLPISWHSHLHSAEMGIDEKLHSITLESIPKLRNFTNNTLLDVLFYTSPKYCQKIMNKVAKSMNEVYNKYRERHPEFNGGVSVAGHSLGSLIIFDLLCHQNAPKESEEQNLHTPDLSTTSAMDVENDDMSVISYTMGTAGTGQPFIHYEHLNFQPKKFFALGSPIGMFVTIRGIDRLGLDFRLPTCSGFYNIFHPFDPVAYRIEALVNPDLSTIRPVLIPHHKGRKRMHLELKETMTRVGADLKQRFIDALKNTLESVSFLSGSARSRREAEETMAKEVDKVINMQIEEEQQEPQLQQQTSPLKVATEPQPGSLYSHAEALRTRSDSTSTSHSDSDMVELDFPLGKLNDSKRIDYVLQEAPLEFINEYIFAIGAHVCYWESEDTILFVMKEIYAGLGISPDSQVPQQSMTIERPSSRNSNTHSQLSPISEKY